MRWFDFARPALRSGAAGGSPWPSNASTCRHRVRFCGPARATPPAAQEHRNAVLAMPGRNAGLVGNSPARKLQGAVEMYSAQAQPVLAVATCKPGRVAPGFLFGCPWTEIFLHSRSRPHKKGVISPLSQTLPFAARPTPGTCEPGVAIKLVAVVQPQGLRNSRHQFVESRPLAGDRELSARSVCHLVKLESRVPDSCRDRRSGVSILKQIKVLHLRANRVRENGGYRVPGNLGVSVATLFCGGRSQRLSARIRGNCQTA